MKPLLLIFRLDSIGQNAHWNSSYDQPLPAGCSAIAISGGTPDVWERRRGKLSEPNEQGIAHPLTPFLASAPGSLATNLLWALTGPGGRFYPLYRTGGQSLQKIYPELPADGLFNFLVSLKFNSLKEALAEDWSSGFFTCFSEGIGLAFWGKQTKLEQKLIEAAKVVPLPQTAEAEQETLVRNMQLTHPFLKSLRREWSGRASSKGADHRLSIRLGGRRRNFLECYIVH